MKLTQIMPPISSIVDKMIVGTKIKHCKEKTIYERYINDKYGDIKEIAEKLWQLRAAWFRDIQHLS